MEQFLSSFMAMMLLVATLFSQQGVHCHGDKCEVEAIHAMLKHGHNQEMPQQNDNSDDDGDMAKSDVHGWHSHYQADGAVARAYQSHFPVVETIAMVSYTQRLSSISIEPPLQPPSLA